MGQWIKRVLYTIILAMPLLIVGCTVDTEGELFSPGVVDAALPDGKGDVTVDQAADAVQEKDAAADTKTEADVQPEAEAGAPEASLDVASEALPEPQPEAGKDVVQVDVAEEPETSIPEPQPEAAPPDAQPDVAEEPDVQVADVVPEDGPPPTLCQQYGTAGAMTVIIQTGSTPPSGKVLAIYGTVKHTVADAGADLPYGVWKFGQAGQAQIVVVPITQLHDLELLFAWGFATPGDTNWNGMGWTMRCTATGCNQNDVATVCAGHEFVASLDHGQFHASALGSCDYHLNGSMTVDEVDCTVF